MAAPSMAAPHGKTGASAGKAEGVTCLGKFMTDARCANSVSPVLVKGHDGFSQSAKLFMTFSVLMPRRQLSNALAFRALALQPIALAYSVFQFTAKSTGWKNWGESQLPLSMM
ncbi:hypothetical protein EON62_01875, partial [archaeon]